MTEAITRSIPIEDPQFYLNDPWPTFRWMQDEAPFYYYDELDCFIVTRHADIKEITSRPSDFISSKGIFLNEFRYADAGLQDGDETLVDSFFPKGGEQVGLADPPRHGELRRVIAPAFSPRAIDRMKDALQADIDQMLDEIVPGETLDWMPIAGLIPIKGATKLIGLPDTSTERVQFWSDELEKLGGDLSMEELQEAAKNFQSLQEFIIENIAIKKANPGEEDLLTVLMNAELDGKGVSEANVVMYAMTVMAAGSDTTRALLSGLIYHLAQNPEQWEILRNDRSLVPLAVEEGLRYVTPARAFARTAAIDTEVNGHPIKAGQRVYLMYMASNRDERVFPDAQKFDVTRKESVKHLAMSAGVHVCAGSRLVRLEAPVLINGLLDRFSGVELAGEAEPVHHVIRNSWHTMPVRFTA